MKKAEKEYKKLLDKSIVNHRKVMRQKMKELRSKNSKEYWKILNSGCRKKQPNISISSLFDFFKKFNEALVNIEHDYDLLNIEPHFINTPNIEINGQITADEILKSIQDLKTQKACGDDNIIKEYIKSSAHLLIPIYVKLFNCIFDSGKVSGTWLTGNIIPIFKNKGKSDEPKNYRPISILSCLGKLFTSILNKTIKCLLRRIFVDQRKPSSF